MKRMSEVSLKENEAQKQTAARKVSVGGPKAPGTVCYASECMAYADAFVVPLSRAISLFLICHLPESLSSCESLQKWTGQRSI